MRRTAVVAGVLVLVLVAALVGVRLWQQAHREPLQRALETVPAATMRLSFTDWARVRADLGVGPEDEIAPWLERAYDRDLTAASSMDEATSAMQDKLGFSGATAAWEAFAQSRKGAAMVVQMSDGTDFDAIADTLEGSGFQRPSREGQVWDGGVDLVASLDPTLSPEVQYVVLVPDEGIVVTSDDKEYAATAAEVVRGDRRSLAEDDRTAELATGLGTPDAAILWAGDFVCEDLSMATADDEARRQGDELVEEAGEVTPVRGFAMTLRGRTLTVAAQFGNDEEAERNLRSRARLAVGPAPGRGDESFSDSYELRRSRAVGATMLLTMRARPDVTFPLSGLYDGPVLFATC